MYRQNKQRRGPIYRALWGGAGEQKGIETRWSFLE